MKKFLLFLSCLSVFTVFSQTFNRVSVNGRIIVVSPEKEGVSVYNTSANQGAYTDKNGDFKIDVGLNDVVEFHSLVFKDFSVNITENILKSRQMTVILVEEVNRLDEVVLLPFGLTGSLDADLDKVRTYNVSMDAVYFGLDHVSDFEFSPDYKTKTDNVAFVEAGGGGGEYHFANVVNIAGFLFKKIMGDSKKKTSKRDKALEMTTFKKAFEKYSFNYIHTNFNVPLNQVEDFLAYLEEQQIDEQLFEANKEVELLEQVNQLSKSYLKMKREKN